MSTKTNLLNFTGQHFHIGIDTHKTNWKVTIRSNHIQLKRFSMNPSPLELSKYMNSNYPRGIYHSVYEAGFCGFWIHRELSALGFLSIVVNAADVPSTHKEKERKRDPIDSAKLSRELENGSLKGIFVPNSTEESLRSVSRLLRQYMKRRVQIKNRIKSFLHFVGILIPSQNSVSHWSRNFICWLKSIEFEQPLNREVLDTHEEELEDIRQKYLSILRRIRQISKDVLIIRLLRTIPGIGLITAFTLYTELININRFSTFDHLSSFVGLVPSIYSSDEKEIVNGLSFRHCKYIRYLLIEASWCAIRKDPALTMCYNNFCRRMSPQKAIIRIAKKLLNRVRFVWQNQQEYVLAVVE